MSAFVYKERSYSFDLTNADDLARLRDACSEMEAAEAAIVKRYTEDADAVEQLRALHGMYASFFQTLFPKNGRELVGSAPSAAEGVKAFRAFLAFLEECRQEEARLAEELRRCYGIPAGDRKNGGQHPGAV